MKLKHILGMCMAALMASACSENEVIGFMDEVKLSSSYVAIPVEGGENTITVEAKSDWKIDNIITNQADETKYGREAELHIICGDKVQFINVRQGSMEASSATCAEVNAGADGKTYRVKGTVTAIANTTYGNWYLQDKTGTVYVYGTLDKEGKTKNFTSLGIEVGDIVTGEGPKKTYSGTVELVDVTVLSLRQAEPSM